MTTATKPRKARKVTKDIVPKGPCVGFDAVESLVWRAQVASMTPPGWLNQEAFEDAAAAYNADVNDALAEHKARAEEYDRQERALRGWQVRHARPAPQHVPVAVATKSGAFYRLNSAGQMEAIPLDEKAEKHMAEILRLHDEQDGTPLDDPGPVPAPSPPGLAADSPVPLPSQGAGPGSSTSDEASDEQP